MLLKQELENQSFLGDCLEVMKNFENKSIDFILCDLPYGTTSSPWDIVIPFDKLWEQYERIIKDTGIILLFGSQPFTTHLISSNLKLFRYEWVWNKGYSTNFQLVKKQPSKIHENICVFYKKRGTYNYQKTMRDKPKDYSNCKKEINTEKGFEHFSSKENQTTVLRVDKYPTSILNFNGQNKECNNKNRIHANQKPLELFEYLINTYTNPGELVLDNCAGSFTTAEAAINTDRKYVCIENEEKYYNLGQERIKNALDKKNSNDTLLISQQHQNE